MSCTGDADGQPPAPDPAGHLLAHNHDKSPNLSACPTPRLNRAAEIIDYDTGEVTLRPLGCRRNRCPVCRRRNVQETAAKMGLNQSLSDRPVSHAILSTTRNWASEELLREGWRQVAREVRSRRGVCPEARYAWFREWTTGRADGIRRTHYHSIWALDNDDQAADVAAISHRIWKRLTNAYSEQAHGWQRVWDAGGLARYVAGLVGHHLKAEQAPPPGWSGRRFGTSRGFYAIDSRELDKQAKAAVRDDRLRWHLEQAMASDDSIPDRLHADIWDDVLSARLEEARSRPPVRIVRVDPRSWGR
jgi:hypothetical protein